MLSLEPPTLLEMTRIGDAVLEATGALRMNYEILGNSEPEFHCHIFPRYASEPEQHRKMPVWFYDWKAAPPYTEEVHGNLRKKICPTFGFIKLSGCFTEQNQTSLWLIAIVVQGWVVVELYPSDYKAQ